MQRRRRLGWAGVCAALCAACVWADSPAVEVVGGMPEGAALNQPLVMISPLFGWDRNKLSVRGERGQIAKRTDTAPMYGLFGMALYRQFVLTDYLFYSDVNEADVWGNLAYLNWYGSHTARVTWNVGAGHFYHKIKPDHQSITVTVPMLKTGPQFHIPAWNLSINPYLGYAWERVETRHGNADNDSYLYGLNIGWRWRMMGANLLYYYQDSQRAKDDYQTLRVRAHTMVNRHWGLTLRFDYMEQSAADNTSVQFGPIFLF